jgi:NAD(P)-dependent dehydrogenase (short-subunit alcohol dehydrogenase family)
MNERNPEEHTPGLEMDRNPFIEKDLPGPPPPQHQEWPGLTRDMNPIPDHGETSYVGSGKLKGMKALVTGGDSGIGRAVCIAFAREGADVAVSYYNEHEDAEETRDWVEKAGSRALLFPGDLENPAHCKEVVERTAEEFHGLNILVNNASVHFQQSDFREITPAQLMQTFRTNVFAYVWTIQAALPHMQPGDVIINSGSVTALEGHPTLVDYAATKAAEHSLTNSLAKYLADDGIRVNCVAPGPVWTPLIASTKEAERVGKHGAKTFWHRPAQPAELAPSYVFLACADSRYYSGEILAPTGYDTTTR